MDPFIAEAYAASTAVEIALEMGFRRVEIEGDALTIIKRLN